jgi:hypothetical protein
VNFPLSTYSVFEEKNVSEGNENTSYTTRLQAPCKVLDRTRAKALSRVARMQRLQPRGKV